jgi:hypothetical protein
VNVDFLVYRNQRAVMMINYAPGSLVTRRLSTLALSRLIFDYQIPIVVVTNGQDAELISGKTGKVEGRGSLPFPAPIILLSHRYQKHLKPCPPKWPVRQKKSFLPAWWTGPV